MLKGTIKVSLVILLAHYSKCARRITGGERVENKTFIVYIVRDLSNETINEVGDISTMCGGTLLLPNAVLTSGTCLKMVPIQYVIAGYDRYIPNGIGQNEKEESCMQIAKIPIIEKFYLHEKSYSYMNLDRWYNNDVSIARLKIAYDLNDDSYIRKCSYKPTTATWAGIDMEQELKDKKEVPVVVYGWGSDKYHVPENYTYDVNQEFLMATATKVITTDECKDPYSPFEGAILYNRFCSDGNTTIDKNGRYLGIRRDSANNNTLNESMYILNVHKLYKNASLNILRNATRRNGPCQNDHGGPVVYWINGKETVVGVITGYLVNSKMECVGPYLYSGLESHTELITCVLDKIILDKMGTSRKRMEFCNRSVKQLEFELEEELVDLQHLDW